MGVECAPVSTDCEFEADDGHAISANVKHDENVETMERSEYMGTRVRKYLYGDGIPIHIKSEGDARTPNADPGHAEGKDAPYDASAHVKLG